MLRLEYADPVDTALPVVSDAEQLRMQDADMERGPPQGQAGLDQTLAQPAQDRAGAW